MTWNISTTSSKPNRMTTLKFQRLRLHMKKRLISSVRVNSKSQIFQTNSQEYFSRHQEQRSYQTILTSLLSIWSKRLISIWSKWESPKAESTGNLLRRLSRFSRINQRDTKCQRLDVSNNLSIKMIVSSQTNTFENLP